MHIYPILDQSGVSLTENSIIVKGTLLCKLSSEFLLVINRSFQQQVIGASVLIVAQIYLLICPSACLKCVYLLVLFGTINLFIWYYSSIHLFIQYYPSIWFYRYISIYLVLSISPSGTACLSGTNNLYIRYHMYRSIYSSIHPSIDISDTFYLVLFIQLSSIYRVLSMYPSIHHPLYTIHKYNAIYLLTIHPSLNFSGTMYFFVSISHQFVQFHPSNL